MTFAIDPTLGIHLLDIDPGLGQFLDEEERVAVHRLVVPTRALSRGALDLPAELETQNCFAAIVLEGMISHRFRVSDHPALQLVGPGDVISRTTYQRTWLISAMNWRVLETTRIALLGDEFLAGVRRWPQILPGLHALMVGHNERIAAQLAICQLPRVDHRVIAMLWLLAESWGYVTRLGTALPIRLTHDVLGDLVGARRSTVTLALGELSERGALIRQDGGWLLTEPIPLPSGDLSDLEQPRFVSRLRSPWQGDEPARVEPPPRREWQDAAQRLRTALSHRAAPQPTASPPRPGEGPEEVSSRRQPS